MDQVGGSVQNPMFPEPDPGETAVRRLDPRPDQTEHLYVNGATGHVAAVQPSPIGEPFDMTVRDEFSYEQLLALLVASLPGARHRILQDTGGGEVRVASIELDVTDKLIRSMDQHPRVRITRVRDVTLRGWRYTIEVEYRD